MPNVEFSNIPTFLKLSTNC